MKIGIIKGPIDEWEQISPYFSDGSFDLSEPDSADFLVYSSTVSHFVNTKTLRNLYQHTESVHGSTGKKIIVFYFGDYELLEVPYIIFFRFAVNTSTRIHSEVIPYRVLTIKEDIDYRESKNADQLAYCGHANKGLLKACYFHFRLLAVKLDHGRFVATPEYSPARFRYKCLQIIRESTKRECSFIRRKSYTGLKQAEGQVRLEYLNNLHESLFQICIRGYGNYSVRFYEVLLAGRIPIIVDSDNRLPFAGLIDYENHLLNVKFGELNQIDTLISDFIATTDLQALQRSNAELGRKLQDVRYVSHLIYQYLS